MRETKEAFSQDSIEPLTIESTEIILEQMKTCVCKIHGREIGTGFFTKIPYRDELISVLITNNHVLNENDIDKGKNISITFNNEKECRNIIIDSHRKRYTNEILDVTIIEIYEKKDNISNFLTLDDKILSEFNQEKNIDVQFYDNVYQKKSIYLLNYKNGKKIFTSYGLLNNIEGIKNNRINHKCYTDRGSSGSPILLIENHKVIGVHYGCSNRSVKINSGTLIIKPILEFQNISGEILVVKKDKTFKNLIEKFNFCKSSKNISNIINKNLINKFNIKILKPICNNNNINNSEYLKHLIRFSYLKKELISSNKPNGNNLRLAYLINYTIIEKLKQVFNIFNIKCFFIFIKFNFFFNFINDIIII